IQKSTEKGGTTSIAMERGIRKIEIMLGNCFNRFLLQLPIYTINIGLLNYTKQPQKNLRL
ncbi:MAG: hypothetical protein ABS965_00965, partial [Succiniclasticum sp.]